MYIHDGPIRRSKDRTLTHGSTDDQWDEIKMEVYIDVKVSQGGISGSHWIDCPNEEVIITTIEHF